MSRTLLKHQHLSLQSSDPDAQQQADVEKIFKVGRGFPLKTGTEAGLGTVNRRALVECAKDYNHKIKFGRSSFVAVDRAIIEHNTARAGSVFVVSNKTLVGRQHDREFPFITFNHKNPRVGRISVAAFHYSTKGREKRDPNNDTNKLYARKISTWMKRRAKGDALAVGAGDFNMLDSLSRQDWAFGEEFLSMADELNEYHNTGHGPIDGFVSYNLDGRVKAHDFTVLDDGDLHFNSDHYLCRGVWSIKHLKT